MQKVEALEKKEDISYDDIRKMVKEELSSKKEEKKIRLRVSPPYPENMQATPESKIFVGKKRLKIRSSSLSNTPPIQWNAIPSYPSGVQQAPRRLPPVVYQTVVQEQAPTQMYGQPYVQGISAYGRTVPGMAQFSAQGGGQPVVQQPYGAFPSQGQGQPYVQAQGVSYPSGVQARGAAGVQEQPYNQSYAQGVNVRAVEAPEQRDITIGLHLLPPTPESTRVTEGIEIPEIATEKHVEDEAYDPLSVAMKYPLIPKKPKPGERVYAYASIYFDKSGGEMIYNVTEPPLDEKKKIILEEIKDYIQEKIDINFGHIKKEDALDYIISIFERAVKFLRVKIDANSMDDIKYYVIRDFIGLENIEPLLQDGQIEDISCDGVNIPIFVYHRNNKIGSVKTNVSFSDRESLDSFANKLAERCGKSISVARPLLDGSLPDGSRVQATLGTDIAIHGSNFTIRMFTDEPITPVDILKSGMCDLKTMAFIWFVVENQTSILIAGGTATGKTSFMNAFSLFIRPQMKIVSIEDTAELRLPHSHWLQEVARASISTGHEVDMFELLRESLRQRPDYIIVGEVRGKEAYVLFQQMATGHTGFATIHADSFQKLIDRLVTPPIDLPPNLLANLDLVLFIRRVKQGNKYKRRTDMIVEVTGFDHGRKLPVTNEIIKWGAMKDIFTVPNKSVVLGKIAERSRMTVKDVQEEIRRRAAILDWMVKKNIIDYRKISSIINLY
ncbi:MAG: type II/IV secretion system ATPase subunit, partial [Candidatus Aenigmarchaeota archaeon]|nr:type II/IV secretion system ATPase subunit [Candidatus Aenigmarchaeota archaeon]MDI6722739.1 type II/IV secretion system ATPase subunit [Candidatus Aenigmarchaeota archaeon]